MCCFTDFSLHHTLHGLADVSDNSSVDTGEVKPSCFNFLDRDVEKLNEFQVDQIFWSIGEERGHGHGKGALVTLKHKVTCSLLIHSVKICLDCHGGFGWVWFSGRFVQYRLGLAVCFLLGLLGQLSKAMPQIQKYLSATKISACCPRFFLVIKNNPPKFVSQGDAPRWSRMEWRARSGMNQG